MDAECEEFSHQITHMEKKIIKLQAEKKKAAEQKKFKEASKAQQEIKEFQTQIEALTE